MFCIENPNVDIRALTSPTKSNDNSVTEAIITPQTIGSNDKYTCKLKINYSLIALDLAKNITINYYVKTLHFTNKLNLSLFVSERHLRTQISKVRTTIRLINKLS